MPKVNNTNTGKIYTPLPELHEALDKLKNGEKVLCNNTKEEILRTRENLTKRRHELPEADDHLDYIEALLIAEANGQLSFKI